MKLFIEQIVVVVASIQMRSLKTEVEKGFMPTAIGHELVSPKGLGNSITKHRFGSSSGGPNKSFL